MPIPEGDCCRNLSTVVQSSVVPLVDLKVGQSARVAYIDCKSDQQLHKIDSLRIKPGAVLTLHQRYPCYVVECEGGNIAMDATVASNISVWRKPQDRKEAGSQPVKEPKANRGIWGRFRRSR
jgi:DtxR family Mn-dependent transcriptional regulator